MNIEQKILKANSQTIEISRHIWGCRKIEIDKSTNKEIKENNILGYCQAVAKWALILENKKPVNDILNYCGLCAIDVDCAGMIDEMLSVLGSIPVIYLVDIDCNLFDAVMISAQKTFKYCQNAIDGFILSNFYTVEK